MSVTCWLDRPQLIFQNKEKTDLSYSCVNIVATRARKRRSERTQWLWNLPREIHGLVIVTQNCTSIHIREAMCRIIWKNARVSISNLTVSSIGGSCVAKRKIRFCVLSFRQEPAQVSAPPVPCRASLKPSTLCLYL